MRPANDNRAPAAAGWGRLRAAALACLALGLGGCTLREPAPDIGYYLGPARRIARIRRVVFIELGGEGDDRQVAADMTAALYEALRGQGLFRVQLLRRDDPHCQGLPLEDGARPTPKQLAEMRKTLGCNAVLIGSVSGFRPFPRMKLGLDLRLLDLTSGTLVWGVDHVWDTTDRDTERRIGRFFRRRMRSGYEPAEGRLGLMSPRAFQKFVAHEVVGTLPERPELAAARGTRRVYDGAGARPSGAGGEGVVLDAETVENLVRFARKLSRE